MQRSKTMFQTILASCLDMTMRMPQNVSVPIRSRYFDSKKPLMRRWGYNDKLAWRGPLPRLETKHRLPKPMYIPKKPWTEEKAYFGQNDYIDILGDSKIHPVMINYNVPGWLRGFSGNEFQVMLRKRGIFGNRIKATSSVAFRQLQKNINYQFKFLNRHQPQNRMPKEYFQYWKNK